MVEPWFGDHCFVNAVQFKYLSIWQKRMISLCDNPQPIYNAFLQFFHMKCCNLHTVLNFRLFSKSLGIYEVLRKALQKSQFDDTGSVPFERFSLCISLLIRFISPSMCLFSTTVWVSWKFYLFLILSYETGAYFKQLVACDKATFAIILNRDKVVSWSSYSILR